tara:strand:+ start:3422 stop:3802 length:381 start_codon:yes stop_codon:yes gene_type:complete
VHREYELTIISAVQRAEAQHKELLDKYEKIFLANNGEIIDRKDWGVKKLCSPINKHYRAQYTFYDFSGDSSQLKEMERLMNIDENILRYMLIQTGQNVDVDKRKAAIAKAEAKADAAASRSKHDEA